MGSLVGIVGVEARKLLAHPRAEVEVHRLIATHDQQHRSMLVNDVRLIEFSRLPSELTAVAMTQQTLTMRPASRHLTTSASSHMYA